MDLNLIYYQVPVHLLPGYPCATFQFVIEISLSKFDWIELQRVNLADRSPISSSRIQENIEKIGLRIRYQGRVQGVGFRPTVWHLARKLSLTGSVFNDRSGAVVEIWGNPDFLEQFYRFLLS